MSDAASRLGLLRDSGGYFSLGPRIVLRITGGDRVRYLNGQISNSLDELEPRTARHALVLTAKGKLCAEIQVWAENDGLEIDADPTVGEDLLARLERYAIADDVAFENVSARTRYHAFGTAEGLPSGLEESHSQGVRVRRLGVEGIDLAEAPAGLVEASAEERECLRIERGIPCWGRELDSDTLPQEAGLDRTAVDFHKGCYEGQEVVSRIESVGRTNRNLTGFVGDFDPQKSQNGLLQSSGETKAGRLCSVVFHPELQKSIALGYLDRRADGETFSVIDESGACLGSAERSEFPISF